MLVIPDFEKVVNDRKQHPKERWYTDDDVKSQISQWQRYVRQMENKVMKLKRKSVIEELQTQIRVSRFHLETWETILNSF
jgi:N-dimethylarginine dimethylaminohydrolase